ncbi:MAG: tetratricopeptide repeat protein [Candidatus Delongbacteria bacterium]|nr:tetratricopeptide repeat protein [Candidatus Delongbacteria bacterium]
MNSFCRVILIAAFIVFSTVSLASESVERNGDVIKIRTSGICYIDPGITTEQAALIAKYDAINEMLKVAGSYLEKNDSLLNEKMEKDQISKYLTNHMEIFVYREGEENVDGYPAYVSHITSELQIELVNRILLDAKIDNPFRFRLIAEHERLRKLFEEIKSIQRTTSRISEESILILANKLEATEWANKAYLAEIEGLKLDYYLVAIDLDVKYEAAYLGLADTMIGIEAYSDLLIILTKLLNLDPLNYPSLYSKRGQVYYIQKQYATAIKELEKAIAINPDYSDAYCVLGSVYADLKKNSEALEKFRQAILRDQNFYKPYFLRATLLRKQGKYDESLKDFDKAVSLNPKNSYSYFNRGIIYYLMGNYERSAEEYSKAIYLKELVPEFYYNRSITYRKLEMLKKATEDYKTYLLLTDKDLNRNNYGERVNEWLADESYNPMLID